MAKDTSKSGVGRKVDNKLDILNQMMNGLYKDTYVSRPDNIENTDRIINRIDSVLDDLQGSDTSISGMTELLRRVDSSNNKNVANMIDSVQDLFSDQNLLGSLFKNDDLHKYIAAQDRNYDMICKYLPKLQDALEIMRDNVLSSDNLNKTFLNPKSARSSKSEISKFTSNTKRIELEYEISEFLDETYMKTSKYGEDFIYIVPYGVAFKRLFKQANQMSNTARPGQITLFENYTGGTNKCTKKGYQKNDDFKSFVVETKNYVVSEDGEPVSDVFPELGNITLHFNTANTLVNKINEYAVVEEKASLEQFKSLCESFHEQIEDEVEIVDEARGGMNSMFDGVQKQNRKLAKAVRNGASDGLIINKNLDRDPERIDKDFPGAVLERLPRENVIPIYIGKKCLGYYYLEFAEDHSACGYCGGHHTTPGVGNGVKMGQQMSQAQQDLAIRYISSKISQAIDTKFINANKDLKEEIYAVLSYNNKFDICRSNDIGVTFLPAEDVVHCYFKKDEYTNRGISDLSRAVIPAMLYILLYLTDIIGKISRSTDKRIYYVKQNVETNVARTMMNVVQQIKKGNMGMRQIESMNNIFNVIGKYNDFIIPMGPSGDAPVQFEVMNGQNIETPTDIMEKMEEAAINSIMPIEFVNSTMQVDYAMRFTMTNARFMKTVSTRQRKVEKFFSKIYTKVYNFEFQENIKQIEIVLPPPTFLTMNNNSQIIDNVTQTADKIVDTELAAEEEEVKTEWKKLYVRKTLSTYIDFNLIDKLLDEAKVNVEVAKKVEGNEGGIDSDVNDMMDDSL